MTAKQKEGKELLDKISNGLKLAIDRLYEKMAANNEMAVVSDGANGVKWVSAKEVVEARKKKEQSHNK